MVGSGLCLDGSPVGLLVCQDPGASLWVMSCLLRAGMTGGPCADGLAVQAPWVPGV